MMHNRNPGGERSIIDTAIHDRNCGVGERSLILYSDAFSRALEL